MTVEKIWNLVAGRKRPRLYDLQPNHKWLKQHEIDQLTAQGKQALVVALDAAIVAGENGRMLTTNTIFDALGARWSDHYRTARETGPANCSWEMRRDTLRVLTCPITCPQERYFSRVLAREPAARVSTTEYARALECFADLHRVSVECRCERCPGCE
jgi:hypothetical protein